MHSAIKLFFKAPIKPDLIRSSQDSKTAHAALRATKQNELAEFYDNEFRLWHCKLALIVLFTLACLYGAVYMVAAIAR